jgi:hypothetical protein
LYFDPRRSLDEAQALYGREDHFDPEGARAWRLGGGSVPRYGITETTIYRWKSKFRGMEVSEAKRLRELETENLKLKRLLAEV